MTLTAEHRRLIAYRDWTANWKNWGPYLSERSWGTVREDYSEKGNAWQFFPHFVELVIITHQYGVEELFLRLHFF